MNTANPTSINDSTDREAEGLEGNNSGSLTDSVFTDYTNSLSEELKSVGELSQSKVSSVSPVRPNPTYRTHSPEAQEDRPKQENFRRE